MATTTSDISSITTKKITNQKQQKTSTLHPPRGGAGPPRPPPTSYKNVQTKKTQRLRKKEESNKKNDDSKRNEEEEDKTEAQEVHDGHVTKTINTTTSTGTPRLRRRSSGRNRSGATTASTSNSNEFQQPRPQPQPQPQEDKTVWVQLYMEQDQPIGQPTEHTCSGGNINGLKKSIQKEYMELVNISSARLEIWYERVRLQANEEIPSTITSYEAPLRVTVATAAMATVTTVAPPSAYAPPPPTTTATQQQRRQQPTSAPAPAPTPRLATPTTTTTPIAAPPHKNLVDPASGMPKVTKALAVLGINVDPIKDAIMDLLKPYLEGVQSVGYLIEGVDADALTSQQVLDVKTDLLNNNSSSSSFDDTLLLSNFEALYIIAEWKTAYQEEAIVGEGGMVLLQEKMIQFHKENKHLQQSATTSAAAATTTLTINGSLLLLRDSNYQHLRFLVLGQKATPLLPTAPPTRTTTPSPPRTTTTITTKKKKRTRKQQPRRNNKDKSKSQAIVTVEEEGEEVVVEEEQEEQEVQSSSSSSSAVGASGINVDPIKDALLDLLKPYIARVQSLGYLIEGVDADSLTSQQVLDVKTDLLNNSWFDDDDSLLLLSNLEALYTITEWKTAYYQEESIVGGGMVLLQEKMIQFHKENKHLQQSATTSAAEINWSLLLLRDSNYQHLRFLVLGQKQTPLLPTAPPTRTTTPSPPRTTTATIMTTKKKKKKKKRTRKKQQPRNNKDNSTNSRSKAIITVEEVDQEEEEKREIQSSPQSSSSSFMCAPPGQERHTTNPKEDDQPPSLSSSANAVTENTTFVVNNQPALEHEHLHQTMSSRFPHKKLRQCIICKSETAYECTNKHCQMKQSNIKTLEDGRKIALLGLPICSQYDKPSCIQQHQQEVFEMVQKAITSVRNATTKTAAANNSQYFHPPKSSPSSRKKGKGTGTGHRLHIQKEVEQENVHEQQPPLPSISSLAFSASTTTGTNDNDHDPNHETMLCRFATHNKRKCIVCKMDTRYDCSNKQCQNKFTKLQDGTIILGIPICSQYEKPTCLQKHQQQVLAFEQTAATAAKVMATATQLLAK